MSRILITGSTGTIGNSLCEKLSAQGNTVFGLSRHWGKIDSPPNITPLTGDVTQDNLGLEDSDCWRQLDSVFHLAGIVNLLPVDKDELIYNTNVEGTLNVVEFCKKYKVPHLFYVSTAFYNGGKNPYEQSKHNAEILVSHSSVPEVTIFRPSLVLGCERQHFSTFVSLLVFIHRRAELIRRKVEGSLRLPVIIEPHFRIHGNPSGRLNLISLNSVVTAMAEIKKPGVFWLTNPDPPTLTELAEIVGKFCMINLSFAETFTATPIEAAFQKLTRSFQPYLEGDDFPSDFLPSTSVLRREDIENELMKLIR